MENQEIKIEDIPLISKKIHDALYSIQKGVDTNLFCHALIYEIAYLTIYNKINK